MGKPIKILRSLNPWKILEMTLETPYDSATAKQLITNRLTGFKIYSSNNSLSLFRAGAKAIVIFEPVDFGSRVLLRISLTGALFTTVWGIFVAVLLPLFISLKVLGVIRFPHGLTWEQGLMVCVGNLAIFMIANWSGPFKLSQTAKILETQVRKILGVTQN